MKLLLIIGIGSFIGGIGRHFLSHFIHTKFLSAFPFGTLVVNITGCFFIGILFGLSEKISLNEEWRLFMTAGILGGFTTFSAFSHHSLVMLRDGQFGYAVSYILSSVVLGIIATFAGYGILKIFS